MKILIVGAGDVGFHLAKLLSYEAQDIILIDTDQEKLDTASRNIDIITKKGDATSPKLLGEINIKEIDLLITVTDSESTNLIVSMLGKKLGAKKTVARISNSELTNPEYFNYEELGVDVMIAPSQLAATEIELFLSLSPFNDLIEIEGGELYILGAILTSKSPIIGLTNSEIKTKFSHISFTTLALKRQYSENVIIPNEKTEFHYRDQVYFAVPKAHLETVYELIGSDRQKVKNVMIFGGSKIGEYSAEKLSKHKKNVKLIEINPKCAGKLANDLSNVLVINGDGRDRELLQEENISDMDAFIAVTDNTETNIISCLSAKKMGVKKTIALVENIDYINLSQNIGIDTLINKKLIAAGHIFRYVKKSKVLLYANLHNVEAEVIEVIISQNSKLKDKPLGSIHIPEGAKVAGLIRDSSCVYICNDLTLKPEDKIVIFCLPSSMDFIDDLFN